MGLSCKTISLSSQFLSRDLEGCQSSETQYMLMLPRMLNIKGAARFAVGIEEGIQAFLDQWRVGKLLMKERMM